MDGSKKMGNQYEVSLEARELYLIIAGLLLFAILVFILGVFVGRRIERSQAPPAAVSETASPEGEKTEAGDSGAYPGAETEAALHPAPAGEEPAVNAPEGMGKPPTGQEKMQYTYYDSLVKGKGVGIQAPAQPQGQPESQPEEIAPAVPAEAEKAAPAPAAKTQKKAKPASTKVATARKPKAAEPANEGKYTIQISSFLERDQAQNLVRWLRERKYPAFLTSAEIPGKGTWHRVRVGRFTTKEIATRYQKELETQIHLRGFVAQMD